MTRKRARIYAAVIGMLVLAVLLRPSAAPEVVQASRVARPHVEAGAEVQMPAIRGRRASSVTLDLFTSPDPPPPVAPTLAPVVVQSPAPPPEVRVLGWMSSGSRPYVFVEWENENYSLLPTQTLGDAYRFDGIENGVAGFTYLPDGTTRQYAVSDVTL